MKRNTSQMTVIRRFPASLAAVEDAPNEWGFILRIRCDKSLPGCGCRRTVHKPSEMRIKL